MDSKNGPLLNDSEIERIGEMDSRVTSGGIMVDDSYSADTSTDSYLGKVRVLHLGGLGISPEEVRDLSLEKIAKNCERQIKVPNSDGHYLLPLPESEREKFEDEMSLLHNMDPTIHSYRRLRQSLQCRVEKLGKFYNLDEIKKPLLEYDSKAHLLLEKKVIVELTGEIKELQRIPLNTPKSRKKRSKLKEKLRLSSEKYDLKPIEKMLGAYDSRVRQYSTG